MLYPIVESQRSLLATWTAWAEAVTSGWIEPANPWARFAAASCIAAGWALCNRFGQAYQKPAFGITALNYNGRMIPVTEHVALDHPFCRLLRFAPDTTGGSVAGPEPQPVVLVCAPLAGHHAVLLRELIETLLPEHVVYVTDWKDARRVPTADGPFTLEDCVAEVQTAILHIGAEQLHVLAICQAAVPALAAVSLLASAGEPTPRSLILMGGPIDARRSPTAVGRLAARLSLTWFEQNLIHVVPDPYPGAGRKVYPSFLQLAGLAAAQPDRLVRAHCDYYVDLVRGDVKHAEVHRRQCDEYNAVLDLAAEFYLDTIRIVFQEFRLAVGDWDVQGQPVRPQDIRTTALLTIEGELDAISGRGQTHAAHDLCRGVPVRHKRHLTASRCGHYDLFSGRRLQTEVFPHIDDLIRQYSPAPQPATSSAHGTPARTMATMGRPATPPWTPPIYR
ncbi:polyhydroxyalkanoate depolymerase [Cupriavidus necator]|uniref:Polyhydroxyalkanoate depolymerase n=1 Tax=Cupriavidus necator TaxID=106590 RepID=A0A1U9UYH8_CUPNE|nr:polyhydroxyalkanoate depolymerase [Cupriavidus necator]AQV97730.1 polyhydroxyalkanoate depolymerase [Cupriavidus necator]